MLMQRDSATIVPLVLDPISAKLAQAAGFEALYLGGGALGYRKTSLEANISLVEMAQAGLDIRAACSLPLILDGACGWGDPMHLHHTIAMAEAAGFAAIEIEDQLIPKRAHHHIGLEHLIPTELMVQKIEAAVAARTNPDFVIIARTNACRTDDITTALLRAEAYRTAGADMLLVLPTTAGEAVTIGERIDAPLVYMVPPSTGLDLDSLGKLGYRLVIEGITPFLAQHKALRLCYENLAKGLPDPTVGHSYEQEHQKVHESIGLERLLEVERRTVEK